MVEDFSGTVRQRHDAGIAYCQRLVDELLANGITPDGSAVGYQMVPKSTSFPRMALTWLFVGPEASHWAVRNVCQLWTLRAMCIAENGCSADAAPGRVMDIERVMFLGNHLTQRQCATAEGYPLAGYCLWRLMNNLEWDDGYQKRFGIHYLDFKTQRRTPKLSADWYRAVLRGMRSVERRILSP